MKTNAFFLFFLGLFINKFETTSAQSKSGMVVFEETRILLTPEKRKQIEDQMPNPAVREMVFKQLEANSKSEMVLYFNENISSYQTQNSEGKDGDSRVKTMGSTTGKNYFKDTKKSFYLSQNDIMGKVFLIEDTLKKINWKMTGEGKQIDKFACQKAIAKVGENEVEAWFALEIPVNAGPANYWGLPGLIIELKEKNGRNFAFKGFKNEIPTKEQLSISTEGKKVSQKEYDGILAQKTKELTGGIGAENGGVKIMKMN